jgi:hypothetical protein
LEKVVETEKAFARFADEKGIKPAFLEFLADDGVMFYPQRVNGKEFWRARPDNSPATLSWYPTFADVSSNGALGYTTGEGEYRPKGKTDATVYYSTYANVWRRQPDGNYRAAFDVESRTASRRRLIKIGHRQKRPRNSRQRTVGLAPPER